MPGTSPDRISDAFRSEAAELSAVLSGCSETEWNLPTRCEPWSVRHLVSHLRVAIAWLPDMLDPPAPERADVDAIQYYRPDDRFGQRGNSSRIDLAREHAARYDDGADIAADFTMTWRRVDARCRQESDDRVVRTRHGDAMVLSEFLLTRVVELAVHGLDLADALNRRPWLTSEAGEVVLGLLVGTANLGTAAELRTVLGWDEPTMLRKVTGRATLEAEESVRVEQLGIRWLTLG